MYKRPIKIKLKKYKLNKKINKSRHFYNLNKTN